MAKKAVENGGGEAVDLVSETAESIVEKTEVEQPKAEEPAVEEPKAEEPTVEEPKAEEPTVEKPKAPGIASYVVKSRLKHDGERFAVDDVIELGPVAAANLLALGAIDVLL